MLVSPSMEIRWKLRSTAWRSMPSRSAGESSASVVTATIVVAMFGWIMPAPLAMPVTRTSPPLPPATVRVLILGRVSVVMMPRAKGSQVPVAQAFASAGMAPQTRSIGSRLPMMPVLFTSTAAGVQSQAAAAASIMASASAAPSGPVAAFAQPEFTTSTLQ